MNRFALFALKRFDAAKRWIKVQCNSFIPFSLSLSHIRTVLKCVEIKFFFYISEQIRISGLRKRNFWPLICSSICTSLPLTNSQDKELEFMNIWYEHEMIVNNFSISKCQFSYLNFFYNEIKWCDNWTDTWKTKNYWQSFHA